MKPLWYIAVIMSIGILLNGCREEPHKEKESAQLPQQQVTVAEVQRVPVPDQIEIIGTVESVYRAEISTKVSGTITTLPVVLGSEVQSGDLLLEISAGEIDAKLQQSHAQLNQAKRNLDRERKLLQKNAATPETVKSLTEMVEIAEAAYQEARIFQSYTRILAPFNGRVTRKMTNIGDLATPGKPLLNIEDELHLQIITDIPEAMILRIKQGDVLSVTVPSAGLTVPGTVAEVAPTANPTTRSAPIKLNIAASPHLRPGQFARVTLSRPSAETLTVPQKSLVSMGQMERLFVVDNGQARLRLVRSGASYGDNIEILSGVRAGEQVIVTGQENIHDGQPIVIQ